MNNSVGAASAQNSIDRFKETSARNIANSVALMLVSRVGDSILIEQLQHRTCLPVLGGSATTALLIQQSPDNFI